MYSWYLITARPRFPGSRRRRCRERLPDAKHATGRCFGQGVSGPQTTPLPECAASIAPRPGPEFPVSPGRRTGRPQGRGGANRWKIVRNSAMVATICIGIARLVRVSSPVARAGIAMIVAASLVLIVLFSVGFHLLSPWWWTPIASNWGYIDTTLVVTFWITGAVFVVRVPLPPQARPRRPLRTRKP